MPRLTGSLMKTHELADHAGAVFIQNAYQFSLAGLERLIAQVKAETKEACAKAAWDIVQYEVHADLADQVAQAIRAKRQA